MENVALKTLDLIYVLIPMIWGILAQFPQFALLNAPNTLKRI